MMGLAAAGAVVLGSLLTGAALPRQQPPPAAVSQPTIRGTVVDDKTSAPIPDARITLVEAGLQMRSGADGRFEFRHVPPRTYTLTVSTIGYIFVRRQIVAASNATIDLVIPLAEGTGTYQETITVSAESTLPKALGVSSQIELGSAALADLRSVAADDPMRAMQALPGVATGDDFQAQFSVRGSAFRHVGVVMDGTPTQLMLHAIRGTNETGTVAMANSDVLARAGLSSGPHTRQHGDWLGTTLEFDLREGSRDRFSARAAVSGTTASAVLEGPFASGRRASWLVSIRRSYLDWLVRKIEPGVDSQVGFTDLQAKAVFDLTQREQLQFVVVAGDAAYIENDPSPANGLARARSRSLMASINLRQTLSKAVFFHRFSLLTGDFRNTGLFGQRLADGVAQSTIWRTDALAPIGTAFMAEGGMRYERIAADETYRNFATNGTGGVRVRFERSVSAEPYRVSGWGQLTWRRPWGGFTGGLRISQSLGGGVTTPVVLPWLLGEYRVGHTTIRGGVGRSAQFYDPVAVSVIVPTAPAETANSYDLSIEHPIAQGVGVLVTGFYRTERDILRRAGEDHIDPDTGHRVPESIFPLIAPSLNGTSQGVEVTVARKSGKGPVGWIAYSWTRTSYDDMVTGEHFAGDFDQRHTLNVFVQQRLSYRMTLSGKFRVGSNFPIVGYFEGDPFEMWLSASRNNVRLPVYARFDVRVNRTFTFDRHRLTLFVEVMNVLGRENLRQSDGSIRANRQAVGWTDRLLPRVPSAGLLFEF